MADAENKKRQRSQSATETPDTKKSKVVQEAELTNDVAVTKLEEPATAGASANTKPNPESAESNSKPQNGEECSLKELLDLSALRTEEEIQARFTKLAEELLHRYCITLLGKKGVHQYDILEAEFYLYHPKLHADPFTHQSFEQRVSGNWYFHRPPSKSLAGGNVPAVGYRDGTRKGLDITFGGPPQVPTDPSVNLNIRGGILLRTLRRRSGDKAVISGPSKLVDELLAKAGVAKIEDLVDDCWERNTSVFAAENDTRTCLLSVGKIVESGSTSFFKAPPKVHRSPRIGLELSNSEASASPTNPRVIYVQRPYRIFTYPRLLTVNGRSQTFVGLYQALLLADPKDKRIASKIAELAGIKATTVGNYVDYFNAGVDSKDLESFIGPKGKGASQSPALYLRMMGVLWSMRDSSA